MEVQYDVIIIGAGPAGMTAAIYASRTGLKVAILESSVPGGKLIKTYMIENYPSIKEMAGADLASEMFEHATKFGAEYLYGNVKEVIDHNGYKEIVTDDGNYTTRTVIVATGTREKLLGIPKEEELTGRGVSYCAVCDGFFFRGKDVAVIGGGNSALEESLYLTQFVNKLYLIIRRDVFRADQILIDKVEQNEKIEIIRKHIPLEVLGEEKVEGLKLQDVTSKEESTLEVSGIFPYIGADPNTMFLKDLGILDEKGYLMVDEKMETAIPGIYGAGDCIAKELRQVVTACSDGAIAGQNCYHFIMNHPQ